MIEDELIHGARAVRSFPSPIESQTPIVPRAVAEAVWEEASVWLDEPLPRAWIPALARRADAIFKHNRRFRQLILQEGNAGRDWLWAFTRHWLAGLVWRHRRPLHARLPDSYNIGHPLPPKESVAPEPGLAKPAMALFSSAGRNHGRPMAPSGSKCSH